MVKKNLPKVSKDAKRFWRKTQHLSWTSAVRLLQEPKLIGKRVTDERMIAAVLFSSVPWSGVHITFLFTPELLHNLRKTNSVGSENNIIFILWLFLASYSQTKVNFQLCDASLGEACSLPTSTRVRQYSAGNQCFILTLFVHFLINNVVYRNWYISNSPTSTRMYKVVSVYPSG